MPISRLEALLEKRNLTVFQPHQEMGSQQTWFEGSMLQANGFTLFWGQRQYLTKTFSDEIRLVRNSDDPKEDNKLVVLFCKHATHTEPRVVFGHPQTPGVNAFTGLYEKSPKPTFDDLLTTLADFLSHAQAA